MSRAPESLSPRSALAVLGRRIFTRNMWITLGLVLAVGYMIGSDLAGRSNSLDRRPANAAPAESQP